MKPLPTPDYVGDAIVIDKAEFARLIRKYKHLGVTLFVENSYDTVARCQSACTGFDIPAAQALEKLHRCDFDAFEWKCDEHGPSLWHYAAPKHLQLLRRRDFLVARIPKTEARIAEINARLAMPEWDNDWRRKIRDSEVDQVASDRVEIAQIDAMFPIAKAAAHAA